MAGSVPEMGRWEPGASTRLQQAAVALYTERGYDQTTVTQIAARAQLTERTFFRHFADKREVLFGGSEHFKASVVGAVTGAPAAATSLDAVTLALLAAGSVLPAREVAAARHVLILANPELMERELSKLDALAAALAAALRDRGTAPAAAELAAQTGVALLRVVVAGWIDDGEDASWESHVHRTVQGLRHLTAVDTDRRP